MAECLVKAEKQSMAPAQWTLAWDEFGQRYPRLKRGPALLAFLLFTFLGQSVLGLISLFYGLIPLVVWLLVFLSTTILAQMFVINFSEKAHGRRFAELAESVKPELEIIFEKDGNGFVMPFQGISLDNDEGVSWELYRVAIRSRSTSPLTRLQIDHLVLAGGNEYSDLFLRVSNVDPGSNEFRLHKGKSHLWDVVEKQVGSDWLRVTHSVEAAGVLLIQAPRQFAITATCDDGFGITKLVTLSVDKTRNNELTFQLRDID